MKHLNQILLVVNPISGDKNKNRIIEKIESLTTQQNILLSVYKTTGEKDLENIQEKIREQKPDRLISVGGDGTIKLCVEALKDKKTSLAIIPAGSANGMATDLGIPEDIDKAIDIALREETKPIDVLDINGETSIHISDIGLNASLIKNYDEGSIRGKLGYAIKSIPTLIDFKDPFRFKINSNGTIKEGSAMMIGIANARKYGNGAIINPKGKLDDGKFEILIIKTFQIKKIFETILDEIPMHDNFIEVISTDSATIETAIPIPFQVDGEYISEIDKVAVKVWSQQVNVVY
ncbi:diacylglycerol/lipid kinase family protein [Galbibacter mesophilus]|uniref:diacylglycerol/lipid kinase family protein n=1 Tax=Galbibacter mesophilus TaxID=379069 RepID=UPI00191F42E2|nr:YegS/Rv2252/BmrU family lipid kinase [Galbibacter mesophilus]MCM5663153.1 YegS/Rv2252/BmrU family lipid kinase [Galbibacter mesophilus]